MCVLCHDESHISNESTQTQYVFYPETIPLFSLRLQQGLEKQVKNDVKHVSWIVKKYNNKENK